MFGGPPEDLSAAAQEPAIAKKQAIPANAFSGFAGAACGMGAGFLVAEGRNRAATRRRSSIAPHAARRHDTPPRPRFPVEWLGVSGVRLLQKLNPFDRSRGLSRGSSARGRDR
jgi:hypothetical protein